jgi:hypothetical protein
MTKRKDKTGSPVGKQGSNTRMTEAQKKRRAMTTRRNNLATLLNQGFDVSDIAALTGVQIPTILRDMRYVEKNAGTGMMQDRSIEDVLEEDLALIDVAISEAWLAWDISKKQTFYDRKGIKIEIPKDPDPRYLELAMRARDRRAKIYGIKDYEIGKFISAEAMEELMVLVVITIRQHVTDSLKQEAIGRDLQRVVADMLMGQEPRLSLPAGDF